MLTIFKNSCAIMLIVIGILCSLDETLAYFHFENFLLLMGIVTLFVKFDSDKNGMKM